MQKEIRSYECVRLFKVNKSVYIVSHTYQFADSMQKY